MKSWFIIVRHMVWHESVIFIVSMSRSTFLSRLNCFSRMVIHDSTVLRFTSTSLLFKASNCTATPSHVHCVIAPSGGSWLLLLLMDIFLHLPFYSIIAFFENFAVINVIVELLFYGSLLITRLKKKNYIWCHSTLVMYLFMWWYKSGLCACICKSVLVSGLL